MDTDREEIIRKAILEKLSPGIGFFTADDILSVAGIDKHQLEEVYNNIQVPPPHEK